MESNTQTNASVFTPETNQAMVVLFARLNNIPLPEAEAMVLLEERLAQARMRRMNAVN